MSTQQQQQRVLFKREKSKVVVFQSKNKIFFRFDFACAANLQDDWMKHLESSRDRLTDGQSDEVNHKGFTLKDRQTDVKPR